MARIGAAASDRALRQGADQLAAALPPLLVEAERVAATVSQGVHGRRRVGTGESFWQFRRYQHGDPIGAIDWRQSAKREPLYIRLNEWEAAQSVWLWRDGSPSMAYASALAPTPKLARADLLLLALASLLSRAGEQIALMEENRPPSAARATLDRIAELLSRPPDAAAPGLPALRQLPRHAQLVLIGDFLSPLAEVDQRLRALAASGAAGHLLQVVDPAEADLPFAGRTRFEGVEGEGSYTVGRVESLRDAYHRRLEDRHEGLKAIARAVGWTFATHRTDRPPQTALLALFTALGGGR